MLVSSKNERLTYLSYISLHLFIFICFVSLIWFVMKRGLQSTNVHTKLVRDRIYSRCIKLNKRKQIPISSNVQIKQTDSSSLHHTFLKNQEPSNSLLKFGNISLQTWWCFSGEKWNYWPGHSTKVLLQTGLIGNKRFIL